VDLFDDLEDFGKFDDAVSGDVRDPYSGLALMRREQPVQRLDTSTMPHEESKPVFMVYRHEEVQQILRDNETFSSAIVIDPFGDAPGRPDMLGMDEPELYGRHRALVSEALSQKALARWKHELVGQVGNQLIDRFADLGRADLTREFTFPYPTQIIAGLLGLPPKDYPQFQRWLVALAAEHRLISPLLAADPAIAMSPDLFSRERGLAASEALREYCAPILAARREEPRDDLISGLAQAEVDGEMLSDEEIFSFVWLLMRAGVETTCRSLGNLLFALLSNPDQLDEVRSDRSLIPQAIEEAVRWEPPVLTVTRVATHDTELAGVSIPAGSAVMPVLGAVNRQEDRYPDPDRFDIFRSARAPFGFGHGVHVCLGMHLARLEMRVALNLLFDRLHNLRLDPEGDDPHIRGHVFRSPTSLPVLFGAAD
jgi:cytochrome P450